MSDLPEITFQVFVNAGKIVPLFQSEDVYNSERTFEHHTTETQIATFHHNNKQTNYAPHGEFRN